MVSVEEASSIVFSHLFEPRLETVAFSEAVDKVLAETIVADRDFPPFDRVSMDGIAISFMEWEAGRRIFSVQDIQAAGMKQKSLGDRQRCFEVMTGAILPKGADTVIPYEDIEINDGSATILIEKVRLGQNVHNQGQDAKALSVLLEPGILLSPAEIALLAAVGKSNVQVFAYPSTAIVSSGDELVAVQDTPDPHQIRRSNTFAIQSAMKTLGWEGTVWHLPDNREQMLDTMKLITASFDIIILSGGVSKGRFDFVPEVLEEVGVTKLFHRVNQRPAKPFWFGVSKKGTIVFALPGNPVSTFMCFYRYIKPWLFRSVGVKNNTMKAVLAKDFSFAGSLVYFLQVSVQNENGMLMAYPVEGGGSGDFANLKNVDGFLELPSHKEKFLTGEVFPYIPFR